MEDSIRVKIPPPPVKPTFTITPDVILLLEDIKAVEQSGGKDARKARQLAISARAILNKIATVNSSVKLLLGKTVKR